nr:MAG TPA: hypothetical protein [Caudoviricetes sp.]
MILLSFVFLTQKKTSNLFPKTGSHKIYMRFSGVIGYKKYGLEKL